MTFDTDLNINRDHLLTKDYLPTKFEASGAKRSQVINCTRWSRLAWPLTLTFDLLTWISIGSSNHQGLSTYQVWSFWDKAYLGYQLHEVWAINMTFDLLTWESIGIIYLSWIADLLSLKLLGQSIVELPVAQGRGDQHDLWPTDLNINRDHLLIKDYPPTKIEASGAKRSWVICCTRFGRLTWPLTYWPEYQ